MADYLDTMARNFAAGGEQLAASLIGFQDGTVGRTDYSTGVAVFTPDNAVFARIKEVFTQVVGMLPGYAHPMRLDLYYTDPVWALNEQIARAAYACMYANKWSAVMLLMQARQDLLQNRKWSAENMK